MLHEILNYSSKRVYSSLISKRLNIFINNVFLILTSQQHFETSNKY